MTPLISIISAVRNQDSFIQQMLDSVSNQNSYCFEHIIIDGQSTDNTLPLIEKYKRDNLQKYNINLKLYPPLGVADGMNKGIMHAKGKWLIFLHGDDYLIDRDSTQRMKDTISIAPNQKWIIGTHTWLYKDKIRRRKMIPAYLKILPLMNFISHPNTLVERSLFKQFGKFRTDLKISMDYELHLRFLANHIKPHITKDSFTVFRQHKKGLSSSPSSFTTILKEWIQIMTSH